MNRTFVSSSSVIAFSVALLSATEARADVSSWLSADVGAEQFRSIGVDRDIVPSLRLSTGMGTDPSHAWILGGLLRTETLFSHGTDLSFVVRLADHGFTNGQWGLALDAGPLARFWGKNVYGATTALNVGAPWGIQVGVQADLGESRLRTYGCFLGIDLARLTVYRRSGKSYWENSFPAYRPTADDKPPTLP